MNEQRQRGADESAKEPPARPPIARDDERRGSFDGWQAPDMRQASSGKEIWEFKTEPGVSAELLWTAALIVFGLAGVLLALFMIFMARVMQYSGPLG